MSENKQGTDKPRTTRKPGQRTGAPGKKPYAKSASAGGFRGKKDSKPGEFRSDRSTKPGAPRKEGYSPRKPGTAKPWNRDQKPRTYGKPAAPKKPDAPMEGLASRRVALQVIRDVTEKGAYASLSLDAALKGSGLSAADRRLATRLVYDTLDHLLYLDHVLAQVMAREDTDIRLKNILRLGACQLLLEDRIPESAATNTCVQLCVEIGLEGLKGVCNGILRNLIRKKEELTFPDPAAEPDKAAALRLSLPEWLWLRLKEDWGQEEAEQIAAYRQEEGIVLRPNLTRLDDAGFEELLQRKIWGRTKSDVPHAWRVTGAMDIARDADFLKGNFSIQSEPSMLAALAVAPKRGQQVLDACAAPGGKACLMAELMDGTGRVHAWDVHPHRAELIASQARRLGLENIRPVARDARKMKEDLVSSMDAVLLDAPCTGLGVLAEKPDIKLRVTEESVAELTALQAELLDAVSAYVKPRGTLVYSTCSVLKDENERQVEAFLERHPEFEVLPLPESVPERFRSREGLGLQLLPHWDGVEGFYICRMRRKA